jgi:PAS domain S-box-containing protein
MNGQNMSFWNKSARIRPIVSLRNSFQGSWLGRSYAGLRAWSSFVGALRGGPGPVFRALGCQNAVLDNLHFAFLATDEQGVIQVFNQGAERMFGYQAAMVVGRMTPDALVDTQQLQARAGRLGREHHAPVAPGFAALVFKALRGLHDSFELTAIDLAGRRFPVLWQVTTLRVGKGSGKDSGKVIGYSLIGHDQSAGQQLAIEHGLLEARWREQQFYTRSLIESNPDPLLVTNARGIVSDVNRRMELLTGCTRDELIGTSCQHFFTDTARAQQALARVLQDGSLSDFELTVRTRGGQEIQVSYNASLLYDRERQLQGVLACARDVSGRKQLDLTREAHQLESQQARVVAEQANLAKSGFLSNMSHELRTPLNAILGFAQLMVSDMPPPSTRQKSSLDQILQAGWYLLSLINEILDLSSIEAGQVKIKTESVALADVLHECHSMVQLQARQRGIELVLPPSDPAFQIRGDRVRLKQVLLNLLSNAIKYNRKDGSVRVFCTPSGAQRLRIRVVDSGVGMSAAQLAQLFQPFNRLGQEAGEQEGTGIGLVVTRQLVQLMGGCLGVESRVGVGSEFWFELDLAGPHSAPVRDVPRYAANGAAGAAGMTHEAEAGARYSLLLVEDHAASASLVKQLVARRSDISLLAASDGYVGLQMARTCLPDVILFDINLPGLSGLSALKLLQQDPATKAIPVLAMSVNARPQEVADALQAGFFRYLTKPLKVFEFMEALDVALHQAGQSRARQNAVALLPDSE